MYKGSSTSSGQPALSPQPISDALLQLDSMLKKLEQAVLSVIKDVEHKKKVNCKKCIFKDELTVNCIFLIRTP